MTKERGHFLIFERDGFRCLYCGASTTDDSEVILSVDHIRPVRLGGSDRADNLVTCCLNCNSQKQDRLMDETILAKFAAIAKQHNLAANIPDDQIVRLKNTASHRRAHQHWEMLTFQAFLLTNSMLVSSDDNFHRSKSIIDVFCLAVHATTEYIRLTGNSKQADQAVAMLKQMIAEMIMAQKQLNPFMQHDGSDETISKFLESVLSLPERKAAQLWLGEYGLRLLIKNLAYAGFIDSSDLDLSARLRALVEANEQ